MPYRYFYSNDSSDSALKTALSRWEYSVGKAVVNGINEYKIFMVSDRDFIVLQNKINNLKIAAIAAPDRQTSFGNILTDSYFDSATLAAGMLYRDTSTGLIIVNFIKGFASGTQFVQRNVDIVGSASLGLVTIVYSGTYTKVYNTPVNGSVVDSRYVKVTTDSTSASITQTNATTNSLMMDIPKFWTYQPIAVTNTTWDTSDTNANALLVSTDGKASAISTWATATAGGYDESVIFDFGTSITGIPVVYCDTSCSLAYGTWSLETSPNNITWTVKETNTGTTNLTKNYTCGSHTFRYIRMRYTVGGYISKGTLVLREVYVK